MYRGFVDKALKPWGIMANDYITSPVRRLGADFFRRHQRGLLFDSAMLLANVALVDPLTGLVHGVFIHSLEFCYCWLLACTQLAQD